MRKPRTAEQKKKSVESVRRCQRRKKKFAVDAFGGKCQICGYDKCLASLCFHHVNGEEKEYNPTYVIVSQSWEEAKKELEKCILVCRNCHGEIHYNEEMNVDYHIYLKPWIRKTCGCCNTIFDTKSKTQIYCSSICSRTGQRITERPSKDILLELIQEKSFVAIGKMFGVTDNAIRKWCRHYELPYRKRDIKNMGPLA